MPVSESSGQADSEELPGGDLGEIGKRPFSVVAAWLLTLVSAAISGVSFAADVTSLAVGADIAADMPEEALPYVIAFIVALVAIIYLVILWLAWRRYQGSAAARLLLIIGVTLSQFVQVAQNLTGARPTGDALLALFVGLLTVYALTSLSARAWTARDRAAARGRPSSSAVRVQREGRIRYGRTMSAPAMTSEARALRELISARREAFQLLLDGYGARTPMLLGSVARGTAQQVSDVDILVEMDPADGNLLMRASGLMEETRELFERDDVDVYPTQLLKQAVSEAWHVRRLSRCELHAG